MLLAVCLPTTRKNNCSGGVLLLLHASSCYRHKAAIRKLEQSHKERMLIIHRQIMHLLRTINSFKTCIAVVLDRENLPWPHMKFEGYIASRLKRYCSCTVPVRVLFDEWTDTEGVWIWPLVK